MKSISTASSFYNLHVNDKTLEARFSFVFLKNKEDWKVLSHRSSILPEKD